MTYKKSADISMKERLAMYEKARKELIASSDNLMNYLKSTGIYTKNGNLTKIYK